MSPHRPHLCLCPNHSIYFVSHFCVCRFSPLDWEQLLIPHFCIFSTEHRAPNLYSQSKMQAGLSSGFCFRKASRQRLLTCLPRPLFIYSTAHSPEEVRPGHGDLQRALVPRLPLQAVVHFPLFPWPADLVSQANSILMQAIWGALVLTSPLSSLSVPLLCCHWAALSLGAFRATPAQSQVDPNCHPRGYLSSSVFPFLG